MKKELSDKQQDALRKIFRISMKQQELDKSASNRRTSENMMKWNNENLSPNGGKKPFLKTQKEGMTKKPKSGWLTRNDEQ